MTEIIGLTDERIANLQLEKDGAILGGADFLANMVAQLRQTENVLVPTVTSSGKLGVMDMTLKEMLDRVDDDGDKKKVVAEVFYRRYRFLRGWYLQSQIYKLYESNPVSSGLYTRVMRNEEKKSYEKGSEVNNDTAPICVWSLSRGVYEIDPLLETDGVRLFHYFIHNIQINNKPDMLRDEDFNEVKAAANVTTYLYDFGGDEESFKLALYKHGSRVEPALCALEMVQLCYRHNQLVASCQNIKQVQELNKQLRRRWVKQAAINVRIQAQADAKRKAETKVKRNPRKPTKTQNVSVTDSQDDDDEELEQPDSEAEDERGEVVNNPDNQPLSELFDLPKPKILKKLNWDDLISENGIETIDKYITNAFLTNLSQTDGATKTWLVKALEALLEIKPVTGAHLYSRLGSSDEGSQNVLTKKLRKQLFKGKRRVLYNGTLTEPFEVTNYDVYKNYNAALHPDKRLVFLILEPGEDGNNVNALYFYELKDGKPGVESMGYWYKLNDTFPVNPQEHLLGMFAVKSNVNFLPDVDETDSYSKIQDKIRQEENLPRPGFVSNDDVFEEFLNDDPETDIPLQFDGYTFEEIKPFVVEGSVFWYKKKGASGNNKVHIVETNNKFVPMKNGDLFKRNDVTYRLEKQGNSTTPPRILIVSEEDASESPQGSDISVPEESDENVDQGGATAAEPLASDESGKEEGGEQSQESGTEAESGADSDDGEWINVTEKVQIKENATVRARSNASGEYKEGTVVTAPVSNSNFTSVKLNDGTTINVNGYKNKIQIKNPNFPS